MRKILPILIFLVLCVSANVHAVENYLHTNETLKFEDTEFVLGWSSHPTPIQYLQEYYPAGQSPENFKDMLSVWVFVGDLTAQQYIEHLTARYEERKKRDMVCNYQTYKKEANKEFMFDCLLSEGTDEEVALVEFNIYRFKEIKIDGKKALLICFYTTQTKDDDIMPFLSNLKDRRAKMIMAMAHFEYPEIKLDPAK